MSWPEGPFVLSFSGGRTSGMMLITLLELWGPIPERGRVSFQNTGKEAEPTLEFIQRCAEYTGVDIVWLEFYQEAKFKPLWKVVDYETASRKGEPFLLAMEFEGGHLPSHSMRFCTKKLKIELLNRYLNRALGWDRWISFQGIRADETHRLEKKARSPRETRVLPLVDLGVTKADVFSFWARMPFDLELPIVQGKNYLGNCTGCFLKSEMDLALLAKNDPADFQWWMELEKASGRTFKNGWSYEQLLEKVQSGVLEFAEGALLCQADQGECTGY